MTGATGAVSTLTRSQWLDARIRPAFKGGPDATPVLWDDVLEELGGHVVLVLELKASEPEIVDG